MTSENPAAPPAVTSWNVTGLLSDWSQRLFGACRTTGCMPRLSAKATSRKASHFQLPLSYLHKVTPCPADLRPKIDSGHVSTVPKPSHLGKEHLWPLGVLEISSETSVCIPEQRIKPRPSEAKEFLDSLYSHPLFVCLGLRDGRRRS